MKNMKKIERLKREMDRAEEVYDKVSELPDIRVEGCYIFNNKKSKEACWKKYTAAEAAYYKELSKEKK